METGNKDLSGNEIKISKLPHRMKREYYSSSIAKSSKRKWITNAWAEINRLMSKSEQSITAEERKR